MHLLIIDPDPNDVEIFCEAVEQINPSIHCIFVKNGKEAMKKLKSGLQKPAIIFSDIDMPEMDGIDFLKTVKKDPEFKDIPVVIYTASPIVFNASKVEDVEKMSLELGASRAILKPVKFDEVIEIVKSFRPSNEIVK